MPEKPKTHSLWHQSGVNPHGVPFVQLILNDKVIAQMTPAEARDHARAITEAAEASETDAFLWTWVLDKVGADKPQAAGLIADFRRFREQSTGKSQGPTKPDDWVMPDKPPDYGDKP
jgi:hypothetical protein